MVAGSSSISAAAPGDAGAIASGVRSAAVRHGPLRIPCPGPLRAPHLHSHCPLPYSVLSPQPGPILSPAPLLPRRSSRSRCNPPQIRCSAAPSPVPRNPQIPLPLDTLQSFPFSDPAPLPHSPAAVCSSPHFAEPDPRFHPCPITQGSPEFQRRPGALRRGHGLRSTEGGRGYTRVRQRNTVRLIPRT